MAVLGWMELPEDDMPEEELWLDQEAITKHFADVKARYRQKREESSGEWEQIEERPTFEVDDEARKVRERARAGV